MKILKKQYHITVKGPTYGFQTGNQRRKLFTTKEGGFHILMTIFAKHEMSAENALALFTKLNQLPLPISEEGLDKVATKRHWDNQAEDLPRFLKAKALCEKTGKPNFLPCSSCGKHGRFMGKDFVEPHDITSKSEAFTFIAKMYTKKMITQSGKTLLLKKIAKSELSLEPIPNYDFFFIPMGKFSMIIPIYVM